MQRVLNILRVYNQAGAGEMDAGLRWYLVAHEEAKRLGDKLRPYEALDRDTTQRAAGIIAALSPGMRWENNVEAAERVIRHEGLEGLGVRWYDGVRKAERIRDGEALFSVLRGNKVHAFCDNLAYPTTSNAVTIDGHAWGIWAGERSNLDETPELTDKLYARIATDYNEAAKLIGIRPMQLQAITWTVWRRLHNVSSAHYLLLFEEN